MDDYRPSPEGNARTAPLATSRHTLSDAWPALLVLGFLLLLVWPVLDPSQQLYDGDTGRCDAPFKWELWRRLAQHQLPLWVTWTEGGTSLLGQMTPGLFHPTALLYLLPFGFEALFKAQHLLALPLCALGFFLFARQLGAGRWGAAGGALAYAGSGWVVSMAGSNLHFALGAAAIPFALHGLGRFLATRRPLWLLWGAFALACPVLGGEPQSSLFAGLLGLAMAAGARRETGLHPNHWYTNLFPRLALAAAWGTAALLLSASAALPVALRLHGMAVAPGTVADRGRYATPPWRLAGLAIPGAFDETLESTERGERSPYGDLAAANPPGTPFAQGIALGAPLLLLGLFAPHRQRRWLLGAGLACALASCGPALGLDRLLVALFPPLGWFRYPEKWLGPATLFFSLAGALGATALFEKDETYGSTASRKPLLVAAASAIVLLLAALVTRLFDARITSWIAAAMDDHSAQTASIFAARLLAGLWIEAGLLAALAALLALQRRPRTARLAPILCTVLLGTSALADSQSLLYTMPVELLRGPVPIEGELRARADLATGPLRIDSAPEQGEPLSQHDVRLGLVLWRMNALATEDNAFRGFENVAIYSSLIDSEYLLLRRDAPEVLRALFDVQFELRASSSLSEEQARREGFLPAPLGLALRQRLPSPRAFLVDCAEALGADAGLRRLAAPGFDPHQAAVARSEDAGLLADLRCSPAPPGPRTARWTRPSPEEIDVEAESRAPALVVVAEHFDPGWTVAIDGAAPVPALHLDHAALGAKIAAGPHHLVFRFFPRGLAWGLACELGCALGLLLLDLALRRRA